MLKKMLSDRWDSLPVVFRSHYDLIPYCHDAVTFKGECDFYASRWMRCLLGLLRLIAQYIPVSGKQIATTVRIRTQPHSAALYFDRSCFFTRYKPYRFYTQMEYKGEQEVIEYIGYGLGVRLQYQFSDQTLRLIHKGYYLKIGRWHMLLPLTWLLGKISFEKTATSDKCFSFVMTIRHNLLGLLYESKGTLAKV